MAIGVAGETVHELTGWFKSFPWWKAKGGVPSALLLIAALAAEVVTQVKTNEISEQIIVDTRKRAAAAELALAQFKAPRAVSPEERNRIAEKMKEFAGQEYTGLIGSGVGDAWDLWREIGLSLDLAGWKFWCCISRPIDRLYGHEASIWQAPIGGIHIFWPGVGLGELGLPSEELQAKQRKADAMRPSAQALAEALAAEGLPAFGGPIAEVPNHPVVVISIGPKPQK